jgi:alkylation response protein AidB-like acyl-CoA dehydrogenase
MESALDLAYNEDQEAIRAALSRFCTQHAVEDLARLSGEPFPRQLWLELAELGAFFPAAPGDQDAGGALAVCAISETLGHHLFPGPVAATYLAIQVVDADEAAALMDGRLLVSLCHAGSTLLPWGTEADLFLVAGADEISRAHTPRAIEAVPTLGGETWGRATLSIDRPLAGASRGLAIARISTAAYLASAAWRLLTEASDYAATRRQFGKTLGEFQAVAHPLAECAIGLTAAQTLARAAACDFDRAMNGGGNDDPQHVDGLAAGALLSAQRASLDTAYVCHQVFAGIGITLEGPAFHISRRIRQLVSAPPGGLREQDKVLAAAGLGVSV